LQTEFKILFFQILLHPKSGEEPIISTQSVPLISLFEPNDLLVVNRESGKTVIERCSEEKLKDWLEDYSLGQLWEMNLLGGRPSR